MVREAHLTRENLTQHTTPTSKKRFVPSHNRAYSQQNRRANNNFTRTTSSTSKNQPFDTSVGELTTFFHIAQSPPRTTLSFEENISVDLLTTTSTSLTCEGEKIFFSNRTQDHEKEDGFALANDLRENDDLQENDATNENEEDDDDESIEKEAIPSPADYLGCAAKDSLLAKKIASVELIPLDMPRTFSVLGFFQV